MFAVYDISQSSLQRMTISRLTLDTQSSLQDNFSHKTTSLGFDLNAKDGEYPGLWID